MTQKRMQILAGLLNEEKTPGPGGYMGINDFSDAFIEFYSFLNNNAQYLQDETKQHLKQAIEHLNKAWEYESETHGVDFEDVIELYDKL